MFVCLFFNCTLFYRMLIFNLHCKLFFRISGTTIICYIKTRTNVRTNLIAVKKAGLANRNIVHFQKIILRCVGVCFCVVLCSIICPWHGFPSRGRRDGLMVSALFPGSSGPGSSPGWRHCVRVVFLGKTHDSQTVPLSTLRWTRIPPRGVEIPLAASCYRNRDI